MIMWIIDISNGEYIPQPNEVCSRLCNNKNTNDNVYSGYSSLNAAYSPSSRVLSQPPGTFIKTWLDKLLIIDIKFIFTNTLMILNYYYFFISGSLRSRGFDSNFVMSSQQQLSSANLPYWRSLTGSCIEIRHLQIILKP